jgi:hypothetical protein
MEVALVDRGLTEIPLDVATGRGDTATTLNLTENAIT